MQRELILDLTLLWLVSRTSQKRPQRLKTGGQRRACMYVCVLVYHRFCVNLHSFEINCVAEPGLSLLFTENTQVSLGSVLYFKAPTCFQKLTPLHSAFRGSKMEWMNAKSGKSQVQVEHVSLVHNYGERAGNQWRAAMPVFGGVMLVRVCSKPHLLPLTVESSWEKWVNCNKFSSENNR